MIPRTKVNYGLRDLARALVTREGASSQRDALLGALREWLGHDRLALAPSGRGALFAILSTTDRPDVVVPAYTCKAVVEAAMLAGKNVRYVDCAENDFNLDARALEGVVDDRCVVIATHQFGIPCDIERIVALCRERGALVVEDAAPALGTRVAGRTVGTFGDVGFFSFDSTKLITVPMKGGLIVAQDQAWFERIAQTLEALEPMPSGHKLELLAQAAAMLLIESESAYRVFHWLMFDRRGRFTNDGPGLDVRKTAFYRYAFAEWQASIARVQIERIDEIVEQRRRVYARLRGGLQGCRSFELPPADQQGSWACIRFPIRVRGDKLNFYRRGVRRGIDFAFSFTFLAEPGRFPHADRLAAAVLDVPFYFKLSEPELRETIARLRSIDEEVSREGQ